jgi:hypothetical protein
MDETIRDETVNRAKENALLEIKREKASPLAEDWLFGAD